MKLPIKIAVIVLVVVAQTAGAWVLMSWIFRGELEGADQAGEVVAAETVEEDEEAGEKAYDFGDLHPLTDLIINPRGSVGRRIFKISLALEYDPENTALAEELAQRAPFMRDFLISYLGAMDETTLSDITYREVIRDSLMVRLNDFLQDGELDRVLFQDFIRQ